jgi:nicotinamidase-related amidase
METTHNKLTPYNCVAVLINFQTGLLSTIDSIESKTLTENAFALAKTVSLLGIPAILTTIGASTFGGPLLPQLRITLGNGRLVECHTVSVWENRRVYREVKRTGRRKIIMAGLWTDFCIADSAIQALKAGYEVYMVTDASGDLNAKAQETGIRRMIPAGARPMKSRQILAELGQHEAYFMPEVHSPLSQRTS